MSADNKLSLRDAGDRALRLVNRETATDDAVRLYPHSDYLQTEWRRAVEVVRSTSRGWLLDRQAVRQERRHA